MSKKNSKNLHKNNKKITKLNLIYYCFIVIIVIIVLILAITLFFKKKSNSSSDALKNGVISSYSYKYDENGNLMQIDNNSGETKITSISELETLTPRKMKAYESESREKQEIYNEEERRLKEKLEAKEITEEEFSEKISEAILRSADISEYLNVIDDYVLTVDKNVYNECNQSEFMKAMRALYTDYNAVVNVLDESVEDEKSTKIIVYVSGFNEKDFDSVRIAFQAALNSDNFTFEKNMSDD